MTVSRFVYVFAVLAAAALGACNGTTAMGPTRVSWAPFSSPTTSSGYRVLYDFKNDPDGSYPEGPVLDVKGTLYGTTFFGGTNDYGVVYKLSRSGNEQVLHAFKGSPDGAEVNANLVALKGLLYGTTVIGGKNDAGTVFSIAPTSGTEKIIFSFKSGSRSSLPYAGLVVLNGALYGTTLDGGAHGYGTIYRVTPGGKLSFIYSFKGESDGSSPVANLVTDGVNLFGTTEYGGKSSYCGSLGCGTVFEVTPSGNEKVLHSFKGGADGEHPLAALIVTSKTLYGTTYAGGADGFGTVFSLTASGHESILHNFAGGPSDGAGPKGGVLLTGGALYGTTYDGGYSEGSSGWGVVFKVNTSGQESILHIFGQPPDGSYPYAGLTLANGHLYGTTSGGGTDSGTMFELTP